MEKQLISGRMTSKGKLTIPVELRTLLNLQEGDRLTFVLRENNKIIEVQPKKKKSIRNVIGILKAQSPHNFDEAGKQAHIERAEDIDSKMRNLE